MTDGSRKPNEAGSQPGDARESQERSGLSESERIRELRDRLYSRGDVVSRDIRRPLPHQEAPVAPELTAPAPAEPAVSAVQYADTMATGKTRSRWRRRFLIIGGLFFVAALAVSSFFMFSGGNTISGDNISLSVSGPLSVGGGEEFSFQVSVANQNTVPIQSATLIVEYPDGTHSATDVSKELSVVRESLDTIGTGELVNVPFRARMFGEENEEKEIRVSIDYRIEGSNATFHKEATPLRFKVSTSPIVLTFDTVKSIASGQELTLTLTVQSNSPAQLSDILVKLAYPEGFDFTDANPDTVSGEDTWKFPALKPGEKKTIVIRGLATGYENDVRPFSATAGVASGADQNTLASMLARTDTEVVIEKSFFDVGVSVNGETSNTVIVAPTEDVAVEVQFKNVLDTAVYDGEVLVTLSGNALNEFNVVSEDGFYDSTTNTIRWDAAGTEALREILPGTGESLRFTVKPKQTVGRAPEIKLTVSVSGARVFEERATDELIGIAERTIRIESIHTLDAFVRYGSGPFTNTGPIPPVAEQVTQYTYTLMLTTGANDVTGAEVTAVLPQYVKWLDLVTDGDKVTYNASTRTIRWVIGDVKAKTTREVSMQVAFLPSLSQVGAVPTLLEIQRFKATDRFTGTVVRAEHPALTTKLENEGDVSDGDGRVRAR